MTLQTISTKYGENTVFKVNEETPWGFLINRSLQHEVPQNSTKITLDWENLASVDAQNRSVLCICGSVYL